jgi:cell division septation protein DedD
MAAALVLGTAYTAQASSTSSGPASSGPTPGGSIVTSLGGVPSHLSVGDGFTLTVSVKSETADDIYVQDLEISMWNMAQGGFSQTDGITVTWTDPTNGASHSSSNIDTNGVWTYTPVGQSVIKPDQTFTWRVHITMTSHAKQGTEHIMTNGLSAYGLVDPHTGQGANAILNYNMPQTTFGYGSGSSGGSGSGSSGSSGSQSKSGGSTSHTTAPATHAASPSPSPSHSATPSPSPSTQDSTSAAAAPTSASPTPSNATIQAANTASTSTLPIWGFAVLLVAAGAGGLLITWRMRRRPGGGEG